MAPVGHQTKTYTFYKVIRRNETNGLQLAALQLQKAIETVWKAPNKA